MRAVGQPFTTVDAVRGIRNDLEENAISPTVLIWIHWPTAFADPGSDIRFEVEKAVQTITDHT